MPARKILLAAYFDLGYSARMRFAVEYLSKHGYVIDLITLDEKNCQLPNFNEVTVVDTWEKSFFPENSSNPYRTIRIATNLFHKTLNFLMSNRVARPIETELQKWIHLNHANYDLVWAVNLQSLPSVVNALAEFDLPVVYETLDLVAEYPYDRKLQNSRRIWEKKYLPKVSALITAGNQYARYYKQEYSYPLPITVVHNFAPLVKNSSSVDVDALKFLFFGNITFDRPIDMLIDAFAGLSGSHTLTIMGVNLLGSGPEEKIIKLGLENRVKIIPPVGPEAGSLAASKYDVGIAMLDGNDVNERLAPTAKIGTYLSAGLAIVATNLPGMREELSEVKALYANAGDVNSWRQIFFEIAHLSKEEIVQMKTSAFSYAQKYPLKKELEKYLELFEKIISNQKV